jgi:hypothetical protein
MNLNLMWWIGIWCDEFEFDVVNLNLMWWIWIWCDEFEFDVMNLNLMFVIWIWCFINIRCCTSGPPYHMDTLNHRHLASRHQHAQATELIMNTLQQLVQVQTRQAELSALLTVSCKTWNLESWNLGILESYHITAEHVIIKILLLYLCNILFCFILIWHCNRATNSNSHLHIVLYAII